MKKLSIFLIISLIHISLIARNRVANKSSDAPSSRVTLKKRTTSEPFISGDTFRPFCTWVIDEMYESFDPAKVKTGDIIFVSPDFPVHNLSRFFSEYHPQIKCKYILVTHNGDLNVPKDYMEYLEDDKIFAWFGQNANIVNHPKFIPIPIGLENAHYNRKYKEIIMNFQKQGLDKRVRNILLYANVNVFTNVKVRQPVADLFSKKRFCHYQRQRVPVKDFLTQVVSSKFVVSPHGNGLDCHRTWEALYLGSFPVVKRSTLDPLYKDLPVVIVDDWHEVTEDFLNKKYEKMKNTQYNLEKLTFNYWTDLILEYQKICINAN